MENVINLRFPHIGEQIFDYLDSHGLIQFLTVSKSWTVLAGNVLHKRGEVEETFLELCKSGQTEVP